MFFLFSALFSEHLSHLEVKKRHKFRPFLTLPVKFGCDFQFQHHGSFIISTLFQTTWVPTLLGSSNQAHFRRESLHNTKCYLWLHRGWKDPHVGIGCGIGVWYHAFLFTGFRVRFPARSGCGWPELTSERVWYAWKKVAGLAIIRNVFDHKGRLALRVWTGSFRPGFLGTSDHPFHPSIHPCPHVCPPPLLVPPPPPCPPSTDFSNMLCCSLQSPHYTGWKKTL